MWLNIKTNNTKKKKQKNPTGRPKQTFLQRRHTDGQEAHEKVFNVANYQRKANQNYNEISPHQSEWPSSKSLQTKSGEGAGTWDFYTIGGNVNGYSHYGEQCGDSLEN